MRILTAQEFLKESYGTVYIKFKPDIYIGNPKIKIEPRGVNSWWATDVLPWFVDDVSNKINEYKSDEIETEEFCTDDAIYNYEDDMLYAVYNKEEVKGMISRLSESLELINKR